MEQLPDSWLIRLHARYCRARVIRWAWVAFILCSILQALLIAYARP